MGKAGEGVESVWTGIWLVLIVAVLDLLGLLVRGMATVKGEFAAEGLAEEVHDARELLQTNATTGKRYREL